MPQIEKNIIDFEANHSNFLQYFLNIVILLVLSAMVEIRKSPLSWRIVKKTCLLLPLASSECCCYYSAEFIRAP